MQVELAHGNLAVIDGGAAVGERHLAELYPHRYAQLINYSCKPNVEFRQV